MKTAPGNEPFLMPAQSRIAIGICSAVFLVGVVLAVSTYFRGRKVAEYREGIFEAQAELCARTGLVEAINWLRRQPSQPVVSFRPNERDSLDPTIGLVREFAITDDVWGRYEVWRSEKKATRGASRRLGVTDVSAERGHVAPGFVWKLRSAGFVFERKAGEPFDRDAAGVLHREVLEVEVARLGIRLPGQAALCIRQADNTKIGSNARIAGGGAGAGIYHAPSATEGLDMRDGEVSGAPAIVGATAPAHYDDSVVRTFGVSRRTLWTMADSQVTDADFFPANLRPNTLHCVEVPDLSFTKARPLRGSGILYVKGDVTIEAGSDSLFTGLLFVDGDLSVRSKVDFRGAVVVTGRATIRGDRDLASLHYDDGVLRMLGDAVGSYRMSTPVRQLQSGAVTDE